MVADMAGASDAVPEASREADGTVGPTAARPWHEIISGFSSKTAGCDAEDVKRRLVEAVDAAENEIEGRQNNGIVDLLRRARDSALSGAIDSARRSAAGVLEFHQAIQRQREQPVSSDAGEGD